MWRSVRQLAVAVAVAVAGGTWAAPALAVPPPEIPEMRMVEPVTNVTGTTAIVHGVLDPKAASPEALVEYAFFYGGPGTECTEGGHLTAPEPAGFASGTQGAAVETTLSGLIPDTEYSVCVGARNEGTAFDLSELSAPAKFKTVALPPEVVSESVSERWTTAVLLETRINNEAEPTECHFQYGEVSVSEHEVSCGGIGGYGEQTLSAKVGGLTAGHTYHWRTVAKNEAGTSEGKEESFTTTTTPELTELSIAPFAWSPGIGVPVTAPANAGGEPEARFDWGACPMVGYCAGVGSYTDEHGNREAMVAARTNGSWGQAVEITLPAGAATSGQTAGFGLAEATVTCTGPGACVAVGHYLKEGSDGAAMVVAETGGVWGVASEIKLPANAASNPEPVIHQVACPALGECVAVGVYTNNDGDREAMIVVETDGVWGMASEIELPTNAASHPASRLWSVACSAVGSCAAAGEYSDGTARGEEAMVVIEAGGNWARASQMALPANAKGTSRSFLGSVVCVASGPCVAHGRYTDGPGDEEAMVAEETGGSWGPASEIAPPANAASNPKVGGSIACPASGSCVMGASYTDEAGDREAMVAVETGGSWGPASEIRAPANAASNPNATLQPACAVFGSCVLVGAYTDEGGNREAMVVEGVSGLLQAREVAAPVNAAVNPGVVFGEVQCPALGSCVAFGEYTNHAGATSDMEVVGMTAPENTVAPIVGGTAKVGQGLTCSEGTWTASPTSYAYRWLRDGVAIGAAESSVYTVTAADEGHSIFCEVTATNPVGSKSVASANSVVVREEARERREAEEAAAASKRQEEEVFAAKKHQEEAAAKKKQEEAKIAVAGSVSLTGSVLSVQSGGRGSVKLTCVSTVPCTGKLTLTVTSKGKGMHGKKAKAKAIGAAAFSIPAGKTEVVTITLTTAGRALLKAGHGKLSASLTILKSSPAPASTKRKSVLLVQKKVTKAMKRKG
jgi:hypothetical protein